MGRNPSLIQNASNLKAYTCREKTMGVFMSSEEECQESILMACSHCGKYKNDDGYWEYLSKFVKSLMGEKLSHGICPECLKEHFPDLYTSLCNDGKIVVKQMVSPDNKILYGCFLIVNNTGCLYGEYDKE
jgi:hypothetical protein